MSHPAEPSNPCADSPSSASSGHPRISHLAELVAAALERSGAERARYLDRACGDDLALRDEVESLVRHATTGPALLGTGQAVAGVLRGAGHQDHRLGEVEPQRLIGSYRVLSLLGSGGMGAVYRATQEHPRRVVAIKVMTCGLADEQARMRFQHEAEVLGLLQHPGIAQVYEAGTVATELGALPYFAMELVEGPDLLCHAGQRHLDVRSRCLLLASVCDAVQHAHQRGVVHRDLKPQNILVVEPSPGQPQPKVLDFGIARATRSDLDAATLETRTGQVLGTMPYMSPEQLAGLREQIDARTDVYSLGVILYQLLTGQLPFAMRGLALHEALAMVEARSAPRLRRHDVALRGDLETIVDTALARERDSRYASAAALAADLRRFVDHEPIAARPRTTFYQLHKFARRNRALVLGTLGMLIALLAGLVAVGWLAGHNSRLARSEHEHRRQAEATGVELRRNLYCTQMRLGGRSFDQSGGHNVVRELLPRWIPGPGETDLRGWEWYFLFGTSRREEVSIQYRFFYPWLSWASRDRLFVRADGGVFLVDPAAGMAAARTLTAERWAVLCDATPDGELLVACGHGHGEVLDRDGQRLARFAVEDDAIPRIDPRGRWVAVQDRRAGRVQILSLPEGTTLQVLGGDGETLAEYPSISGDGGRFAAAIREGNRIRVWDTSTWRPVREWGTEIAPTLVQLSPDGSQLAAGTPGGTVSIWDVTSGRRHELRGHTQAIFTLAWRRDGLALASGGRDLDVRLWSLPSGDCRVLGSHRLAVCRVAFSPDGGRLASLGGDELRTWHLGRPWADRVLAKVSAARAACCPLRYSADGRWLAGGPTSNGRAVLRDARTGDVVDRMPSTLCALSHDDRYLAFVEGTCVRVRAVGEERLIASHDFGAAPQHLEWSPTEHVLAAGTSAVYRVWLWRPLSGEMPSVLTEPQLKFLRWHPDGRGVGTYSWTTRWVVAAPGETREALHTRVQLVAPRCNGVAFSPDGARAAFAREDAVVDVRDADGTRTLLRLAGHTQAVVCVAWSPDGLRVASGSRDRSVRVWDAESGEETVTVPCAASVASVAWSPDGRELAVATEDGALRILDSGPGREAAMTHAKARPLGASASK